MLLSDQIENAIKWRKLVEDPEDDGSILGQVQPASYDLRLGAKCYLGDEQKIIQLDAKNPALCIPPQDVAILSTREVLHMPRDLIGRWNIRIGLIYKGVLLVSGPQVDPGYDGQLYCVVYNFSTKAVILKKDDHIATIDFVTTTPYREHTSRPFIQSRKRFEDYIEFIQSQPREFVDETTEKLRVMGERLERAERLVIDALAVSVATTLAIAALIIAFVLKFV